jgi:hypothetical protein
MTGIQDPQAISLAALRSALSEPRLEAYRLHTDERPATVLGRYRWNIALSKSFYPVLGLLEVALRNNLHRVIARHHGSDAWYDLIPTVLASHEREAVLKAKAKLQERQKLAEPNRVVAELSFGFWTSLLGTDYEQKLWPRLLSSAFPHMPRKQRTRSKVAHRFHQIRVLRNRISHHEPIYRMTNLAQLDGEIEEALGWLSPNLLRLLPVGESFREVYARGPSAYELDVLIASELST